MRTFLFKHEGSGLYHARIEVWSYDGFVMYSKYFTSDKDRKRWIEDKLQLLKIIPPVFEPDPLYYYMIEDTLPIAA